ncbi:aminoglycoside phosphotransferase [Planosporangium thailandense]|uniref:Glucosamine kinase n=1 Tax=Planosporangium thailandense TaxID=765197 RepID=A0ABX0Y3N8_9ACTN|nr:aminoglycoside phosphotransferase [Planosporangium thailandense]NJC71944.1 aminoglycoside phosphotransferase [Planosporangium thailandense]
MDSTNDRVRPGASAALVEALATGGAVAGLRVRRFVPLASGPLEERMITVDQTNTSVVVGERVVVKWMRPAAGGRSPDRAPDLLAHLAAAGFTRTPTPYAAVYHDGPDGGLAAVVTGFLPDASDGWDWCVDALLGQLDGGPPDDHAGDIGVLAAELHCALATPSGTIPVPVTEVVHPTWAGDGLAVFEQAHRLVADVDDEDARWFTARAHRLAADIGRSREVDRAYVIQPHGDLHVGQILRWRGGLAVTDFDGNPTLATPDGGPLTEPAARDVAQLRTSLLHVGQIANRRTGYRHRTAVADWCQRAVDDLLVAYRRTLDERGMAHLFDERLLRPFEVEQECRELCYAARFLPRWRYAPMGVLRSWYD